MENEVSNSRNVDTSESNQDPYLSDVHNFKKAAKTAKPYKKKSPKKKKK